MHPNTCLLLLSIFVVKNITAQPLIDSHLLHQMQNNSPSHFHKIRIEFQEQFDVSGAKMILNARNASNHERALTITQGLSETATRSQAGVRNYLADKQNQVKAIQPFWIANVIFCEAQTAAINGLLQFQEINGIFLENNRFELGEPYVQEEHVDLRGPGGTEPSIEACNVRPLWEMGYTGRGRKVFVYDTGVWPTHPAISNQFMGNRTYLNEAWYGYYHSEPNGERNSHGTHVLGTMLGLDRGSSDSIGIAMNAYWIANDHVGNSIAVMPDLPFLMGAYQWALNPDGDFNSTTDIPDVINNSFRWYDGADQEQCTGIVVDLMIAIEAAGIANIYSGGNQGPNNTTISAPQRINVSEVNTFSVGSVNGNLPFPHPLSSFSSLGPKQCPGSGSLSIHPEVVAPGQNVRSAWAQNEYNTISGTSMASPHVSGVALLLKEAFPYLTGEDILWAIYLTAVDMGEPGEDNMYGMGMIDAHAAFLYLAQNHTSVNPNAVDYDLEVVDIMGIQMNGLYCGNSGTGLIPTVILKNKGNQPITSIKLEFGLVGGNLWTQTWNNLNLTPGQVTTIGLGWITPDFTGQKEFLVKAKILNAFEDYDLINNSRHVRFNFRPVLPIPYIEEFENGWNSGFWGVRNNDNAFTWRTTVAPHHHPENRAAVIQLPNYSPTNNQRDELRSPRFQIPQEGEIRCTWDVSYRRRSTIASHQDTLYFMLMSDCFDPRDTLTTLAGESLAVIPSPNPNFIPQNSNDWKTMEFDLNAYRGQEIQFIFQSVNRAGNNIYIDNFRIFEAQNPPLGTVSQPEPELLIYPNPSSEKFVFELNNVQFYEPYELKIFNVLGQQVEDITMQNNRYLLDLSKQPSGIYTVVLDVAGHLNSYRLVKY